MTVGRIFDRHGPKLEQPVFSQSDHDHCPAYSNSEC